ncbi:hypothetical protein UB45_22105 [Terrabacter sp. 28]|nr:hypothetical protein UB45_22105 [Terrabacter sp. 28]
MSQPEQGPPPVHRDAGLRRHAVGGGKGQRAVQACQQGGLGTRDALDDWPVGQHPELHLTLTSREGPEPHGHSGMWRHGSRHRTS